jgi:hypothetical protein
MNVLPSQILRTLGAIEMEGACPGGNLSQPGWKNVCGEVQVFRKKLSQLF